MKTFAKSTALLSQTEAETPHYRFPSPAKLNLFLYINGRRADGYHELQTLFQFLDYGDWLTIEPLDSPDIRLVTDFPDLKPEDNLIYRAAKLLQQQSAVKKGAKIAVEKRLPMGGGIGGGSSNAATTLVALNQLWQTGFSLNQLAEWGLSLGADVPIFVRGHAAFAEGVGEKLTNCNPPEKWYVVLKPDVMISTAKIFNDPDLPRHTPKRSLAELFAQPYENDCEKVVRNHYPTVEKCRLWLLKYAPTRLTGTGACVFAEFDSQAAAQAVFAAKPEQFHGFVAKGVNRSPLHQQLKINELT